MNTPGIELVARSGGECRVRIHGEIDMATIAGLSTALTEIVGSVPSGGRVVVDLAQVTFMSAAGARLLALTGEGVRGAGGVFVVDPVSPVVARVLRVCGCGEVVGLARG